MKVAGWIIACGLLVFILLSRSCDIGIGDSGETYRDTATYWVFDTLTGVAPPKSTDKPEPVDSFKRPPVPRNANLPDTVTDTVYRNVDTPAILDRYFTAYVYERTFEDSNLKATLRDTVSRNKITGSSGLDYELREKTRVQEITTRIRKNKILLGAGIGGNQNRFEFEVNALYQLKTGHAIGAGYDPINKTFQAKGYLSLEDLNILSH